MRLTELAGAAARCLDVITAIAELEDGVGDAPRGTYPQAVAVELAKARSHFAAVLYTLNAARDAVQRELVGRAPGTPSGSDGSN